MAHATDAQVVLYVEDSAANARLMERIFARSFPSYRLVVATDGLSGLIAISEFEPFLVLLDCHLPDMPGAEVVRRARALGKAVAIVAVTADARPELADEMREAGADALITKPFNFELLFDEVRKQVGSAATS